MSSSASTLTDRQARTVTRLVDAATGELRAGGLEGLTVRNVARRAGVAAATAYNYFGSKEHLVTETFWRHLRDAGGTTVDGRRSASDRVRHALSPIAELASTEPELMAACTVAMMADDPDVKRLRDRVGGEFHRWFVAALGEGADPSVLTALELALAGALVRAGMGHLAYADIPARIAEVACLLVEGKR